MAEVYRFFLNIYLYTSDMNEFYCLQNTNIVTLNERYVRRMDNYALSSKSVNCGKIYHIK